jgi:hypothetical protein
MRLPRVRLRLWWLMVLIGAIAVFLGTWIEVPRLRELSRIYRSRANHYAELERRAHSEQQKQHECLAFWSALAAEREQPGGARASSGDPDGGAVHVESRADRIARTWEQAAWHAGRPHSGRVRRRNTLGCDGSGSGSPPSRGFRSSRIRPIRSGNGPQTVGAEGTARDDWDRNEPRGTAGSGCGIRRWETFDGGRSSRFLPGMRTPS